MSTNARSPEKRTAPQITGPHVERDRHDRPTGATFFRYECCGAEYLTRDGLRHAPGCSHEA